MQALHLAPTQVFYASGMIRGLKYNIDIDCRSTPYKRLDNNLLNYPYVRDLEGKSLLLQKPIDFSSLKDVVEPVMKPN